MVYILRDYFAWKDDVNFEYFVLKLINCNYRMIILYKFIRCIMEADPNGKFVSGIINIYICIIEILPWL